MGADGDFLADAAETKDAEGLAGQFGEEAEIAMGPLALAHELVGLRNTAGQRDHEADGEFGNRVVEHVGRVGDADIAGARRGGVDIVVADPEAGDDFEIGQRVHEIGLHARAGMGADAGTVRGQPGVLVGLFVQLVHGIAGGQRHFAGGKQRMGLKNLDGHGLVSFAGRLAAGADEAKAGRADLGSDGCKGPLTRPAADLSPRGRGKRPTPRRH
jgi:hypothetical protein